MLTHFHTYSGMFFQEMSVLDSRISFLSLLGKLNSLVELASF